MNIVVFHRVKPEPKANQNQNQNQISFPETNPEQAPASPTETGGTASSHGENGTPSKSKGEASSSRLFQNLQEKENAPVNSTFAVRISGNEAVVTYRRRHNGGMLDQHFSFPMVPWSIFAFDFDTAARRTSVDDMTLVDTYRARNLNDENYIGRVLITDTVALLYLSRCFEDVAGVKNVVVRDNESTNEAFFRYAPSAREFVAGVNSKREFALNIDPRDSLSYLEAQVDILTRIILESGIADKSKLRGLLAEADKYSVCKTDSADTLMRKMKEKKAFREKQRKYLSRK